MTRLARSEPGYTSAGSLPVGSVDTNILLNRLAGSTTEAELADYAVTNRKLADYAVSGRVIDDSALAGRHFPDKLLLSTLLYAMFAARTGAAQADGQVSFYAAAASGGAVTQLNTLTFLDGLLTDWTQE